MGIAENFFRQDDRMTGLAGGTGNFTLEKSSGENAPS
jgi:hypothetical protein